MVQSVRCLFNLSEETLSPFCSLPAPTKVSSACKYNPHFQFFELSQSPASEDTSSKHTKDISHGPSVFSCDCELGIGRKRRKVSAFICSMAPIPLSTRAVLPDAANSAKPISISACSLLLLRLLSAILT